MKCDYPACANEREEGDLYCISHNRKYTCFPVPESAAPSPGNREQALRDALHNAIGDCCFGRDGTLVSWLRAPKDVEDYLYEKLSATLAAQGDRGAQGEQNHLHECPASEPEARLDELKDTVILLLDSGFTAEERRVYIKNRCKQLREVIALARPSESKETKA